MKKGLKVMMKKKIFDVFNTFLKIKHKGIAILVLDNWCFMSDLTVISDNMTFHIMKLVIWRQSLSVTTPCYNSKATWNWTK